MSLTVINVEGMTCNHCKMAVEKGLKALKGVESAEVNLDAKNVTVSYDESKAAIDEMKNAIVEAGYEPR